jgi:hypothetical protein
VLTQMQRARTRHGMRGGGRMRTKALANATRISV